MSYRQRTTRLAGTIVACATVVAMVQLGFGQQAGIDRRSWKDYGGAPDKARFVTFNQITKANVARLEVAWTYPMGDNAASVFSPTIVDNVMYVVARDGSLIALDATTGREI